MRKSPLIYFATTAVVASLTSTAAIADEVNSVVLDVPPAIAPADGQRRTFPGIFGVASAVAAPGGSGYAALTYVSPRGGVSGAGADGDIALGYTIGNPIENLSVSAGVNINGLIDNFGDSGNLNLSLSRMVNIGERSLTFVGASAGNLAGWGDASDSEESFAGYVSHVVAFDSTNGEIPVQFTLGYGNQTTLSDDGRGTLGDGVFYGVGVGVTETLSLSLSGTETQFNVGGTVLVPAVDGLAVSAGVYDATDNASRRQYALTVAFSF
jgi:hypothetical protein